MAFRPMWRPMVLAQPETRRDDVMNMAVDSEGGYARLLQAERGDVARYRILTKLAAGGMAEVFLAKAIGAGGFEKPVALKRMLPSLASDANFVEQFRREARLSVALQHPNIVQVLDLGVFKGAYYLVMEYVDGDTLRALLSALATRGEELGIAECCWITLQVARGLDHAHTRKGPDGKPLNIIHRDINPMNVMVSSSGEVKLADFGIAKAADGATATQVGVIKGKASYLSPEQVLGAETDQRSDLFLMGLLLYELLYGKRLFDGTNYFQALRMIEQFDPGQLETLPGLGGELHPILSVALARDPDARLGRAEDLATALESFLFDNRLRVGAGDVAAAFGRAYPDRRSPLDAPPPTTLVEIDLEALDPTPGARPMSGGTAAARPPSPLAASRPGSGMNPAVAARAPGPGAAARPGSGVNPAIKPRAATQPSLAVAPRESAPAADAKPPTPVEGNPKPKTWRRFGEILMAHGKISEPQLNNALARQKRKGGKLSDFLLADGLINDEDVIKALGEQSAIPFIGNEKLRTMEPPEVAALLPEEKAVQLEAVPISQRGKVVFCAMFDPRDNEALKTLRLLTQAAEVKGVYATRAGIRNAIRRFYGHEEDDLEQEWMGKVPNMEELGLNPFADKVTGTREIHFDEETLDRAAQAGSGTPAAPAAKETLVDAVAAEHAALELILAAGQGEAVGGALSLARRTASKLGAPPEEQARAGAWLLTLLGAAKKEGRPLWSRPGSASLRGLAGLASSGALLDALNGGTASRAAGIAVVVQAFCERTGGSTTGGKPASEALAAMRNDPALPRPIVEALGTALLDSPRG